MPSLGAIKVRSTFEALEVCCSGTRGGIIQTAFINVFSFDKRTLGATGRGKEARKKRDLIEKAEARPPLTQNFYSVQSLSRNLLKNEG